MDAIWGALYDEIAADYERVRVPRFRPFVKKLLQLYDTRPGSCVLDAGCGTGLAATMVAVRAGHGGKVIGIDASEAMLEIARAKARGFGFDQCEFRAGDVGALEFGDGTFDVVISSFAAWGELPVLLQGFHRVLKPGGALLLQEWAGAQDAATGIYDALLSGYRTAVPDAVLTELRAWHTAAPRSEDATSVYAQAALAAGFAAPRVEWCALPLTFADANELREFLDLGAWHFAERRAMDPEARARFETQVTAALRALGDGKIVLEKRALQLAARK